jgi:radical SAM protein with 4Fe4S-binding SPASM domain
MCDIWKVTDAQEISARELARHTADIEALGIEWVVFSGGEPLMHSDFFRLTDLLHHMRIRTSLLTTGLLVAPNAEQIVKSIDDVIVSLDGPASIHDEIRRLAGAFDSLRGGVRALLDLRPDYPVSGRCTVQQTNHNQLRETVRTARELGLQSISFLAADVTSEAFNRPGGWPEARQDSVRLSTEEVDVLSDEMEALIRNNAPEIERRFIRETPEKLRRIVHSFRVQSGVGKAAAPRCNAPWTSAVVESDGTLRPCFFHQPIGNVHEQGLLGALNSPKAVVFRRSLDIAANPTCRQCTCSLYWEG